MDVIKWACLHTFCMWCVLCVCVNADYYYMKWINDNALLFVQIFLHCCARSISFLCFFFFSFIHFALNNEWLENNHDVVTLTRNENTKLFTGFNILYVYVIHHRFTGFPPFFLLIPHIVDRKCLRIFVQKLRLYLEDDQYSHRSNWSDWRNDKLDRAKSLSPSSDHPIFLYGNPSL